MARIMFLDTTTSQSRNPYECKSNEALHHSSNQ